MQTCDTFNKPGFRPPSSVHTSETTPMGRPQASYSAYRRYPVQDEWEASREMYASIDAEDGKNRLENFENCCSRAWFSRHKETGQVRIAASKCNLRWCPVCARTRAAWITHNMQTKFRTLRFPKLLTLTLRHSDDPLYEQIDRLYTCFNKLRQRKPIKERISGGIWFFQVKLSSRTREWHPHIHCIVTGKYISINAIKNLWKRITGDSSIVDIRMVKDKVGASNEVARYAARPASLFEKSNSQRVELFHAMHGRKICGTWGDCKHISLVPKPLESKDNWENVGSYNMVLACRGENSYADAIFNAWKSHEPLDEGITLNLDDIHEQMESEFNKTIKYTEPPWYTQRYLFE